MLCLGRSSQELILELGKESCISAVRVDIRDICSLSFREAVSAAIVQVTHGCICFGAGICHNSLPPASALQAQIHPVLITIGKNAPDTPSATLDTCSNFIWFIKPSFVWVENPYRLGVCAIQEH